MMALRHLMEQETERGSREELREEPRRRTRRGKVWDWTGFGDKTAWDWMQLLIVPLVLAVGALSFNEAQTTRQLETEERRAEAQLDATTNAHRRRGCRCTSKRWETCSSMKIYSGPKKTTSRATWRERAR
jgi:hypothetical protein